MSGPLVGVIGLLAAVLLILVNGVVVAAEFALLAARRTLPGGDQPTADTRRGRLLDRVLTDPNRYVTAAQVATTAFTMGLGLVCGLLLDQLVPGPRALGVVVAFVVIALAHTAAGTIVPRAFGVQQAERTALAVVVPLVLLARAIAPIAWVAHRAGSGLVRLVGLRPGLTPGMLSQEELRSLLAASYEHGVLEDEERVLLANVFEFSETTVEQVMVPRPDVLAVDVSMPDEEIVRAAASSPYSRLPMYETDLDHILGILHVRDVFGWTQRAPAQRRKGGLRALLRTPAYVPETKPIQELLADFQRKRTHMAVVLDEYGGTAGLVTLEDVIEELVGEIDDEFDPARRRAARTGEALGPDGEARVEGQLPIEDFNRRFGCTLSEDRFRTIAGYVFGELGRAPAAGDRVVVGALELAVAAVDGHRITELVVSRNAGSGAAGPVAGSDDPAPGEQVAGRAGPG